MSMTATQAQQLYVAYFNRPADTLGLAYWTGKPAAQASAAFASSAEYTATYAGMSNAQIVNAIYTNLFGRPAEPAGISYWGGLIENGKISVSNAVTQIAGGAQGTDLVAYNNKVTAAAAFTAALDTTAEIIGYSGTAANNAAKVWMSGITTDATLTAATTAAALNASIATATAPAPVAGVALALTNGGDVLSTTSASATTKTSAGDDLIYANTDGFLTSADIVDAGGGNDTIFASVTAAAQTIAPILTSVETVTITHTAVNQRAVTFDAANATGLTTLNIKNAGSASHGAAGELETVTLSNLAKAATVGIIGGTAITGTVAGGDFTGSVITAGFSGAAAADTQNVSISSKGIVGVLTLSTAETVSITATGTGSAGANTIGSLGATSVKTLNLLGAGDLTVSASDMAASTTVNATTATGSITFAAEAATTSFTFNGGSGVTSVSGTSTGIVKITTGAAADTINVSAGDSTATIDAGAGNDRVLVGAQANVTAADSIKGGDGTDTLVITDATVNGTTKTALATGSSGFEVLETTATAEVSIDYNALSAFDVVQLSGASGATAAASATSGVAGIASIAATTENADSLIVSAARIGQVGSKITGTGGVDTAGAGGAGITITPRLDNGANTFSVKFVGDADSTGGAGGAGAAQAAAEVDVGGAGGAGLSASATEVLNIDISGTGATGATAASVDFVGGAGGAAGTGGAAGAAGSSVVVGTNATINLTSSLTGSSAVVHNNVNLGTVIGTNVTINGSAFLGKINATAGDGNVTITGGSAADTLTGGAGQDTISGGAGADVITGGAAKDVLSGGAGRDSFTIGTAGHSGATTADTISDFGKVTVALTAAQVTAMTNVAAFQASATGLGGAEADMLDMFATATLVVAASGTDVSAVVTGTPVVTGSISAKGIVTVAGAGASSVDTLAEWVGVANIMAAAANGNVAAFEFGGSTYVFAQGATDDVVQLVGVTGVTGITLVGGAVAAAVGDIFII